MDQLSLRLPLDLSAAALISQTASKSLEPTPTHLCLSSHFIVSSRDMDSNKWLLKSTEEVSGIHGSTEILASQEEW